MSFQCPKCSKQFACRFNMYRHLENKTLPCDFQCDQCEHKSINKSAYFLHRQEHSTDEKVEQETDFDPRVEEDRTAQLNIRTRTRKRKLLFKKHMLSDAVSFRERNDPVNADLFPIKDVTPGEIANLSQSDKVFVLILRDEI